ncbi:MAG: GNAT family N-acetyltransferase [Flavisolibacter sp.]
MDSIVIKIIGPSSEEYTKMIDLRMKVLLQPLGIGRDFIDLHQNGEDILIGVFGLQELLGCCILTPRQKDTIQLRQMAVDIPWQSRGIGRALVAFGEKTALEKKYTKMVLHARNTVIPFYIKLGFHISSPEFFEVGMGHHQMEKYLTGV